MRRRTQRQRPLPPSREKFPFASPHVDEAKMHASEAIEVAAPAPTHKFKMKRVMNVAAPVAVVSVPPPDEVLPTGGVPCASPPVDEDNEPSDRMEESNDDLFGENGEEVDDKDDLDFGDLEFGIVTNLAVK